MKFKTIREAEDYYMENYAATNNMHGEEESKMDRWLEDQDIKEVD